MTTTPTTTARPPEQLAADIRAAVARLRDSTRYVDGVLVREPSLLDQLIRAIASNMGGASGSTSASARERIPLNSSAFELYLSLCDVIVAEARAWTHRTDLRAAEPQDNLGAWLKAFEGGRQRGEVVRSQEEHALRMLDGWVRAVEDLFDPPIRKELTAACPTCGERYWDDYKAETRVSSLRVEYRPGAGQLEASCRWCLRRWNTTRELITLGEAIGVPFNAAAIAEAMSAEAKGEPVLEEIQRVFAELREGAPAQPSVHPLDRIKHESTVSIEMLGAWVTEDSELFIIARPGEISPKIVARGNKALEDASYDERLTIRDATPMVRGVVWVDPAYVAAERWPESSASAIEVKGWVRLWRFDVQALGVPAEVPSA